MSELVHEKNIVGDGKCGNTVVLHQFATGRCRLYWYCLKGGNLLTEDIRTFKEPSWREAILKARGSWLEFKGEGRSEPNDDPWFRWVDTFKPMKTHIAPNLANEEGGPEFRFETYVKEYEFVESVNKTHPKRVWTEVIGDDGET